MSFVPTREASAVSRTPPRPGLYRHFKGGQYELLDVARDSETEELLAVYRALDDPTTIWVRSVDMFSGVVERQDGSFRRFELIAPAKRRSSGVLTRLLLRLLRLSNRRGATAASSAIRSPLRKSGDVLQRQQGPPRIVRSRSGHAG